jgi:hypothetical protein
VGRVVLEGVVDPEYWSNISPHKVCNCVLVCLGGLLNHFPKSWSVTATHIDAMLERFATACIEESKSCGFGKGVKSHTELLAKLTNMLNVGHPRTGHCCFSNILGPDSKRMSRINITEAIKNRVPPRSAVRHNRLFVVF